MPWGRPKNGTAAREHGRPQPSKASPVRTALVLTRATDKKMTNINGVHNAAVPAVSQIGPAAPASAGAAPAQATAVQDTVDISMVARLASQVHELPAVRTEVVQRVKAEIAAGTYETQDKIDVAIDRLMDELF